MTKTTIKGNSFRFRNTDIPSNGYRIQKAQEPRAEPPPPELAVARLTARRDLATVRGEGDVSSANDRRAHETLSYLLATDPIFADDDLPNAARLASDLFAVTRLRPDAPAIERGRACTAVATMATQLYRTSDLEAFRAALEHLKNRNFSAATAVSLASRPAR